MQHWTSGTAHYLLECHSILHVKVAADLHDDTRADILAEFAALMHHVSSHFCLSNLEG